MIQMWNNNFNIRFNNTKVLAARKTAWAPNKTKDPQVVSPTLKKDNTSE